MRNPGQRQPCIQCCDRTGGLRRTPADLDLTPSGFPSQGDNQPLVQHVDPPKAILRLVLLDIEPDNLRAAQTTGKADQQHRPIPQAAQRPPVERLQHGNDVLRHHSFFLHRWPRVTVADTGHDRGNVPVLAIERQPALGVVPAQRRKPALNGGNRVRFFIAANSARRAGRHIKPDNLRLRGEGRESLAPAPGGKMFPVALIGPPGVGGTGGLYTTTCTTGKAIAMRRKIACLFSLIGISDFRQRGGDNVRQR